MSLYLTHRPDNLDKVIGQPNAVNVLRGVIARESAKRPRAFMFHGASGCGKTTLARILATEFGCGPNDFQEMNAAKCRGIDDIREVQGRLYLSPGKGSDCRVWLIDEAHGLTKDAQTALLKTLEDTPKHIYIMLCTTDPQRLLPTIRTRCTEISVAPVSKSDLGTLIAKIAKLEKMPLETAVITKLADVADGSPRKALVLLDALIGIEDTDEQLAIVQKGDLKNAAVEIVRALLDKSTSWKTMAAILVSLKDEDPEGLRHLCLAYCTSVLLKSDNPRAFNILEEFKHHFYDSKRAGLVVACYAIINLKQ